MTLRKRSDSNAQLVYVDNRRGEPRATGHVDNRTAPRVTFDTASIDEGRWRRVNARLSYTLDVTTYYNVWTADGSATAGSDYRPVNGVVTVHPNYQGFFVDLEATADNVVEPAPNETFRVYARPVDNGLHTQRTPHYRTAHFGAAEIIDKTRPERHGTLDLRLGSDASVPLGGDDDFDGVLDLVDFDGGSVEGSPTRFKPLFVDVDGDYTDAEWQASQIRFDYNLGETDESRLWQQSIDRGLIRVWTKDWYEARDPDVDLIRPDRDYSFADLYRRNGTPSGLKLYLEAVALPGLESTVDITATMSFNGPFVVTGPLEDLRAETRERIEHNPFGFRNQDDDRTRVLLVIEAYEEIYGRDDLLLRTWLNHFGTTRLIVNDAAAEDRPSAMQVGWLEQPAYVKTIYLNGGIIDRDGPVVAALSLRRNLTAMAGVNRWRAGDPANGFEDASFAATLIRIDNDDNRGLARYRENFADYFDAAGDYWIQQVETAVDYAWAGAQVAVSFTPGGDLVVTAFDLYNNGVPDTTVGKIAAVAGLLPYIPRSITGRLSTALSRTDTFVSPGNDMASIFWRRTSEGWKRADQSGVPDVFGKLGVERVIPGMVRWSSYCIEHWCFDGETPVRTDAGNGQPSSRRIADIRIGDEILSFDPGSGEWVPAKVDSVSVSTYTGVMYTVRTEADEFRVTDRHPVWVVDGPDLASRPPVRALDDGQIAEMEDTPGRWVDSDRLRVGDWLRTPDGPVPIVAIDDESVTGHEVYNLTIGSTGVYTVGTGGILVHNDSSWCGLVARSYGKSADELAQLRKSVADNWGVAAGRTHGHHIVHKVGASNLDDQAREALAQSQQLLRDLDIPISPTKAAARQTLDAGGKLHNLCIAPYEYVHSSQYVIAVNQRLQRAARRGSDGVLEELDSIRQLLEQGSRV